MKKYNVYGLGNALVDLEYEISPERLVELDIDKGVMTLMDEVQQANIIQSLGGEEVNKGSGGSAANTIIAISQLGGKAFYSCKVADDEMGRFYVDDLVSGGVSTNLKPAEMGQGATGKCLVFVTPDADRTMNTFLGASAEFSPEQVDASAVEESEYVYIEGYLVTGDSTKAAAIHARQLAEKSNTKVAMSLSDPNMVNFFKPGLMEMIGQHVDLLFANEEEAMGMAGADNLDDALAYLKNIATECVITRGSEGAVISSNGELINIKASSVKAVDTVGAGDMFAGAYLYGITNGLSKQQSGDLAAISAARLVASFGPRLKMAETQEILKEFKRTL